MLIEGVGVTAVVVSLLLVVMEIRQNNLLMEAEARYNRLQVSLQQNYVVVETSNISAAEVLLKPISELSAEELLISRLMWTNSILAFEWSFRELPRDELPVGNWRRLMETYPSLQDIWEQSYNNYNSAFTQWFIENVIDKSPDDD